MNKDGKGLTKKWNGLLHVPVRCFVNFVAFAHCQTVCLCVCVCVKESGIEESAVLFSG